MLKVGLTGSIAVGKSTVCNIFRDLGCYVIDADRTAREVVAQGTDGLRQVVAAFGEDVLADDGELDRAKLGSIVFADEAKRSKLNAIVHPLVIAEQDRLLNEAAKAGKADIAIVDAALMIESGSYRRFAKLIVVWCRPEIQLDRLMRRDGLSQAAAEQRIAAQMTQEEKKRYADMLIDTSGTLDDTHRETVSVFEQMTKLIGKHNG